MKVSSLFLMFICTVLFSISSFAQNTAVDQAKAAGQKILTDFNSGNYAGYLSLMADDVEVYTGVYTPLRFDGKTAWTNFINGLRNYAAVTYDQRQPEFRSYNDNTVICNAYFVFTTVTKEGIMEVQSGRETTVFVKINGKWLSANMHFSRMF